MEKTLKSHLAWLSKTDQDFSPRPSTLDVFESLLVLAKLINPINDRLDAPFVDPPCNLLKVELIRRHRNDVIPDAAAIKEVLQSMLPLLDHRVDYCTYVAQEKRETLSVRSPEDSSGAGQLDSTSGKLIRIRGPVGAQDIHIMAAWAEDAALERLCLVEERHWIEHDVHLADRVLELLGGGILEVHLVVVNHPSGPKPPEKVRLAGGRCGHHVSKSQHVLGILDSEGADAAATSLNEDALVWSGLGHLRHGLHHCLPHKR
eukprot:scaffold2473_cov247-Pinguiococcus_pyrenoidosus.AAC.10